MNYLNIAASPILYAIVGILLLLITAQAAVFIYRSVKKAKDLHMESGKLVKAAKTAAITSIVPSIAIVIALSTLSPVLGIPIAWGRLAVIGSLSYELLAANIGASAFGVTLGGAGYNGQAFLTSVMTMTAGSIVTICLTIFTFKAYKNKLNQKLSKSDDGGFKKYLVAAIMISMYARFLAEPVVTGGISLVTMLVSAFAMALLGLCIKHFKWNWMKDFAISFSMIIAMVIAVVVSL